MKLSFHNSGRQQQSSSSCTTTTNNNNRNNNARPSTTTSQHLSSLDPIQTKQQQQEACAKLVCPSSTTTANSTNQSNLPIGGSNSGTGQQQQDNNIGAAVNSSKNQPLYYSVFKLNESVDSPTTNMLIGNTGGKLLYSPTTATSIVVGKLNSSFANQPVKTTTSITGNHVKELFVDNHDDCGDSKPNNLKIVQQRTTGTTSSNNNTNNSTSSSDEDDTTALSGDSNYFDPCNEEDLESEETSDNSDEEEEVNDDEEEVDDDDEEEEEEDSDDDSDDYFNDDSTDEEEDEENFDEEQDENSNESFWFGIEESCHISRVLQLYCNFFGLNAGRSANSRLPTQFIGKIFRAIINVVNSNGNAIDDNSVRTFDIVDIYERTSNLQYGAVHRKLKTVYVETCYDNEGLPKKFRKRKSKDIPEESEYRKSSWLYSFPIYGTSEEYRYESSLIDKSEDIGYADLLNRSLQKFNCKCKEIAGSPNDSQFMYTPYQQNDDDSDDSDCDSDCDSNDSDCENSNDNSIPNYMQDLIQNLSGRGYLDTDRNYGYLEDDK